jgi:ketosteroid isomerase-like protein
MSQQNVEVLRRLFELFSEREVDLNAILELVGPDIVWEVRSDFPDAGVYRGHEGVRRLHAAFEEVVDETWYRPLEYIPAGDQVVVPLRWGGLGLGSRAAFAAREETWVITVRDGRIRQVREYATRSEALEAAGLGAVGRAAVSGSSDSPDERRAGGPP